MSNIKIPIIRKIMPATIAQDLVSVQPVNGNVGQVFSMSYRSQSTTPWEYLENWSKSDRGPDETVAKLNARMQERWPGKYKIVVKETHVEGHMYKFPKWVFEFDTPSEETMFRIKYS